MKASWAFANTGQFKAVLKGTKMKLVTLTTTTTPPIFQNHVLS